uniref:DUF4220 domain-containing protein n=1 Tax=Oryza punctata TaxID=4537 RepID=A0A0E0LT76_ORYPU
MGGGLLHLWQERAIQILVLLSFTLQVLGVAYVLYKHIASTTTLATAAILMFVVGAAKYGERIWAIKCASIDSIRNSLRARDSKNSMELLSALQSNHEENIWTLVEMELSLMYDILYTKASVIHTRYGYCIRVISLLGTASAFFLFQFNVRDGFSRVDATITYILFVGAFLLDITSVLRIIGSTWTCFFLRTRKWDRLHCVVMSVRRLVKSDLHFSTKKWGQVALSSHGCYEKFLPYMGSEFQESVIIWHICTDTFLAMSVQAKDESAAPSAEIVRALSNYIVFLYRTTTPYVTRASSTLAEPTHSQQSD